MTDCGRRSLLRHVAIAGAVAVALAPILRGRRTQEAPPDPAESPPETASLDEIRHRAEAYRERAKRLGLTHYRVGDRAAVWNRLLGVPVVIVTAVVSTSIFATIRSNPDLAWKVLAGVLSIAAAVLSALQTFFGFSQVAERHRIAGANYLGLWMRIDLFLLRHARRDGDADLALRDLEGLVERFRRLDEAGPSFPGSAYEKVRRETQRRSGADV